MAKAAKKKVRKPQEKKAAEHPALEGILEELLLVAKPDEEEPTNDEEEAVKDEDKEEAKGEKGS